MLLVLVTLGSRGDIDPFLALGRALTQRGHQVRLVTQTEFTDGVDTGDIDVCGVDLGRARDLLELPDARRVVRNGHDLRAVRHLMQTLTPGFEQLYRVTLAAAVDADAVLCHPMTFPALDVAQHLGLPTVHVYHVLSIPTRRFPSPGGHRLAHNLGSHGNRLSYTIERWLAWQLTAPIMNRLRGQILARPPLPRRQALALHQRRRGAIAAVSPHLLPRPDDWPDDVVMSGHLRTTHPGTRPSAPTTRQFLRAGPPPLFVTLGSTPVPDPDAVTHTLITAVAATGHRIVLQTGTAGLGHGIDHDDASVHVLTDVDYQALIPHVAAVVHHGGAGTLAEVLWHGKPSLALPSFADQFFWAHRIPAAGAGPRPLPLRRLTTALLTRRLEELTSTTHYTTRAEQISAAIRRENGPVTAATAIETFLATATP